MLVDFHVHGMGHGERKHTISDIEPFIMKARERGIKEIGFTEHDRYVEEIDFTVFRVLQEKYPDIKIRVGLEIDYMPGREEEILSFIRKNSFDYVIGSVHYIGEWMFDHPDYIDEYHGKDIDEIYRAYFQLVQQAARTKMFQIIGHLDLIKVFGFRSTKPVLSLVGDLFQVLKQTGVVVEINTNGFYKPVQEVYPETELLEECYKYDIPITFSSDAHEAKDAGRDISQIREVAKKIGYRSIATFDKGQVIMKDI